MCGIAGFIDFSQTSEEKQLMAMCDVISHRGPDASAYLLENKEDFTLGFGHRRLSIIDLHSTANQPMKFKHWTIIFNGEIYNYKEIKEELLLKQRQFKTDSDTEVILQAVDEWGIGAINKFIGMFAFMLYDAKDDVITLARDRVGVKPLNYYWKDDIFMVASEIKSFHSHPRFKKELNLDAVSEFLNLGYISSSKSIFTHIKKLQPGCYLTFKLETKEINLTKYWDVDSFYEKDKLKIDFEAAKEETERIILNACQYRLVSDVPVGVFLSGGFDSTLVTSLLQHHSSGKIKTFTVGVNDPQLNEAKFAKEIADKLGTDHTEIYCNEQEMFEMIDHLSFHFDEPFGDSSAIPTMLVSRSARKDVTVALSADGGDEVFGGYNRYDYTGVLNKVQRLKYLPLPYPFLINRFIKNKSTASRLTSLFADPSPEQLAQKLNMVFDQQELQKLFKARIISPADTLTLRNENIKGNLSRMMAYDFKTYLVDDILTKVDKATMSVGLEGREPLLDHRILEFAAQLPESFKINAGVKKHILKEITYKYIPKELMDRKKMGFAVPMAKWLREDLQPKLDYYLGEQFIKNQDIFNFDEVYTLKLNILSGNDKHYQKLWYLLVFQMWFERWMIN